MTDTCTRCEREPELEPLQDGYCIVCYDFLGVQRTMTLKTKLAYWLLGTNREEIRKQFRRVEKEQGNSTEFRQLQALLKIDFGRKPSPKDVEGRPENYFDRWQ